MFWLQWRRTYEEGLSPSWVRSQGEEGPTSEDSKDVSKMKGGGEKAKEDAEALPSSSTTD